MNDYRWEARKIASQALGKTLPKSVTVHHHFDGALVLCENHNYHQLLHVRQRAYEITGNPRKRKCWICKNWDLPENLVCRRGNEYFHYSCHLQYHKGRWPMYRQRKRR